MSDELAIKVVIKRAFLQGSNDSSVLQRVAVVYIDGREYRILAPPQATGDPLDWIKHLSVRQSAEVNSEVEIHDVFGVLALKSLEDELERLKRDASRKEGINPDGLHCTSQVCLQGHVQHNDGTPFDPKAYCSKCGAACIDECRHCRQPIRGSEVHKPTEYQRPSFCHGCGRPYPWMEDRLRTARELLDRDDKLSPDERNALWGDLQYVMADPKADLVPAKRKVIEFKLGKAAQYTRDFVIDLLAKIAVDSMNP